MTDHPEPPSCQVAPPMGSDNLLRVIPVAQQQVVDDVSLLIYSLELYETGFVAVVRLSWIGDHGGFPRVTWTARDDRGTTFPYADMAGSGGGRRPDRFSWRIGCMFGAPVPTEATRLDLTATAVGFSKLAGEDERGRPRFERSQPIAGPWRFSILLNGDPSASASTPDPA